MSRYADTSSSGIARRKAVKAIAGFYNLNPVSAATGSLDSSVLTALRQGQQSVVLGPRGLVQDEGCCCPCTVPIVITASQTDYGPFPLPWTHEIDILWNTTDCDLPFTVTLSSPTVTITDYVFVPTTSATTGQLFFNYINGTSGFIVNITVAQANCSATLPYMYYRIGSCFTEGAMVSMADGSLKAIDTVRAGDKVLGAAGEINTVSSLDVYKLADLQLCNINDEHVTTTMHPHISADQKLVRVHPASRNTRVYAKLTTGTELKTIDGSRTVRSITRYSLPADTFIYNLSLNGTESFYVNGYAVASVC